MDVFSSEVFIKNFYKSKFIVGGWMCFRRKSLLKTLIKVNLLLVANFNLNLVRDSFTDSTDQINAHSGSSLEFTSSDSHRYTQLEVLKL